MEHKTTLTKIAKEAQHAIRLAGNRTNAELAALSNIMSMANDALANTNAPRNYEQEFAKVKRVLEIIALGNSTDPEVLAEDALLAVGEWSVEAAAKRVFKAQFSDDYRVIGEKDYHLDDLLARFGMQQEAWDKLSDGDKWKMATDYASEGHRGRDVGIVSGLGFSQEWLLKPEVQQSTSRKMRP